jgi:hypothetical protein
MKKPLMLTIMALLVMLPLVVFAKSAITDKDLDAVTAEAGVTISFTNVSVGGSTALSSMAWGDPSGFTAYTGTGYFGMSNWTVTGNLAEIANGQSMTIDIGTSGTITKIQLVYPTISLGGTSGVNMLTYLKTAYDGALTANAAVGGYIDIRGFRTQMSGTLTIFAHD